MKVLNTLTGPIRRTLSLLGDEDGQDLTEYALMGAFLFLILISAVSEVSKKVEQVFIHANVDLASQVPKEFLPIMQTLDSLGMGNIVFNPVSQMEADKSYDVYLDLSTVKQLPELESDLRSRLKGQAVEGHQIQIGRVMEAHLTGETFTILSETPETQAVDPRKTEWRWEVTPTRGGKRNLYLRLSASVNIDGKPYPHAIETFDKTIEVNVSAGRWLRDFSLDHWEWTCGIIAAAALGIRRLWKDRKEKAKKFGFQS